MVNLSLGDILMANNTFNQKSAAPQSTGTKTPQDLSKKPAAAAPGSAASTTSKDGAMKSGKDKGSCGC